MQLTHEQFQQFYEDGYVVLRGTIPPIMIDAAVEAINASLGREGLPPEKLKEYSAQSFCPELQESETLLQLVNATPVFSLAESALGKGNVLPAPRAQIALRFPGYQAHLAEPRGHLDGIGTGTNGIPKGEFKRNFTILTTCILSPLPREYMGNFTVWPGSHIVAEKYFREASPEVLKEGNPQLDLPRPAVQITGNPGDVVLSHHQLVHTAAPNRSPHIRYAAIFRFRHAQVEQIDTAAMTDIWREWDGVREAVSV